MVLVVIGILIALQINNWNTDRVAKENEQELLTNIIEDLSTDYQSTIELLQKINHRQLIRD